MRASRYRSDPRTVTSRTGRSAGKAIASASAWVVVGMLVGRLAGLLREVFTAEAFGASGEADVAVLLISVPDLLLTLVGTGAVGLVLVPVLLEHDARARIQIIRRLTWRLAAGAALVGGAAVAVTTELASGWAEASGVPARDFRIAVVFAALSLPPSIAVSLTTAYLQAHDRFAMTSFTALFFNAPVVMVLAGAPGIVALGAAVAVGGALRFGSQAAAIGKAWFTPTGRAVNLSSAFRWTTFVAAAATSSVIVAQVSVPLAIAAALGEEGEVALVNFGWRLLLIPIGLLSTLLSAAAYPSLVRALQADEVDGQTMQRRCSALIRPIIAASIGVGVWVGLNGRAAAELVFGRAGLSESDLTEIGDALVAGAAAIPLLTIGTAAAAMLHGTKRSGRALVGYTVATPVLVAVGIVLFRDYGPAGMMFAMSVYGLVFSAVASLGSLRSLGLLPVSAHELPTLVAATVIFGGIATVTRAAIGVDGVTATLGNGATFVAVATTAYAIGELRLRRLAELAQVSHAGPDAALRP